MDRDKTFPFYKKLANILICILAIGFIVIYAKVLFCPLIFALLISILLLPLSLFFERRLKLNHVLACILPVLTLIAGIGLVSYLVSAQVVNLIRSWSLFKHELEISFIQLQNWVTYHFNIDGDRQSAFLQNTVSKIMEHRGKIAFQVLFSFSSFLLFIVLFVFDTFFILFYRRLLFRFLVAIFKDGQKEVIYEIVDKVQLTIRKYLIGLLIEMAIVSTLCSIAFWLIGIKYALFLGLMTGIFNVVPYIGIYSSFIISAFVTFTTTAVVSKVILLAVTLIVVHLLDANIILPFVVGHWSRINAFATVIGLVSGAIIWGIPGTILSIPINAILRIIFERVDNLKPFGAVLGPEPSDKTRKTTGRV
jgi:putative permease